MTRLPIDDVLADLRQVLQNSSSAILVAEPGAGKTTRVPLALYNEEWLDGKRIVMLEPRRAAARSAAYYMAALLGEQPGQTVGYRMRFDSCAGAATRIEVVTEGVLIRMIQHDAALEGIGLIIFDEFHERSLQADVGLALCLQVQEILRPDLKLLVMSATLEVAPLAQLLNNPPMIVSKGRCYSVEPFYRPTGPNERLETAIVRVVIEALSKTQGDVLVFLPGIADIRGSAAALKGCCNTSIEITLLYGGLTVVEQQAALKRAPAGRRKVILATAIAETSLTVDGVEVVVDSGLMRVPRFSPRTGMTHLATVRVSLATATQRQGRAGRLQAGLCFKLWSKAEEGRLPAYSPPEIYHADLTQTALELAVWGVQDASALRWLDCPPPAALDQACSLLHELQAIDQARCITRHGRAMAALGCHPRLAHMLLTAASMGLGAMACVAAAMLSEREAVQRSEGYDLQTQLEQLARYAGGYDLPANKRPVFQRMVQEIRNLKRTLHIIADSDQRPQDGWGIVLALAYPDRVAQRRATGNFLMKNGRGAKVSGQEMLAAKSYIVAVEADDRGPEALILQAVEITLESLLLYFTGQIVEEPLIVWDDVLHSVRARTVVRLGALVLKETPLSEPPAAAVTAVLLEGIAKEGVDILPWTKAARQLQQRMMFMRYLLIADWPDVADAVLTGQLETWLAPYLIGVTSKDDLQQLDIAAILQAQLGWRQRQQLDEMAPVCITAPSGQKVLIDYSCAERPILAVRLQALFGWSTTPCIAGGRVPLAIHILSPAGRPVQITTDLASFWRAGYFDVKRELAGRYPKHYWPDDPLTAVPQSGVRRKKSP